MDHSLIFDIPSESRRANALLRSDDQDNSLHTIYMSNGEVSMHYPKNLNALFNLDGELVIVVTIL